MFLMPPIPSWDALHPLIIHFPIALLLVVPLFIIVALLVSAPRRQAFMISALVLMILGTASVYVALSTGEAAGKLAERTTQVDVVLERHENLAERTRLTFTVLTVILAGMLTVPSLVKWEPSRAMSAIISVVFLVLYGGAAQLIINTAHNGGLLVHQFGVTAMVNAPTTVPAPAIQPSGAETDRD
ncbi:MAG: hypothetical protein LAO23_07410 [Acidobacteriia bacterium]|nr:hypothetical protein [Terriglobia bacterium]